MEHSPAAVARFAVTVAAVLAALGVAALAARDGLFLSQLPATRLPLAMTASAVLAIAATGAVSSWLRRAPPARVASRSLWASGLIFVVIGGLAPDRPGLAAVILYLHVTGIMPVIASAFWSVVSEGFDPYSAKRAVARMAAAGALGGVGGGVAAERVTTWGVNVISPARAMNILPSK